MIRKAFRMSVNPGQQAEYARRHDPIWAELEEVLRAHGVSSYSIFLDPETNELFAYAEVESDERWTAIGGTDACRRWWASMRELMPSNADDSPVSRDLREVFHLEGPTATGRARESTLDPSTSSGSPRATSRGEREAERRRRG